MALLDDHLFVCTLGGNIDREVVRVNPPTIGTGDHQRDMTSDLAFIEPSFAERNMSIFKARVGHCLVQPLGQFLNKDIHPGIADTLFERLSFLIGSARILVTAPAGRLIDLATWCSQSVHRIVLAGVDDPRCYEGKVQQLISATELVLNWPLADGEGNVIISRGSQSGPLGKWTVKKGDDGQPCDVEFMD